MRECGISGFSWVPSHLGTHISYLLDRNGTLMGEVCRLPSDLADGLAGAWSWRAGLEDEYGTSPTEAEAFRQCERALREALERVASECWVLSAES